MLLLFTTMLFQFDLYCFGWMDRCSSFFDVIYVHCDVTSVHCDVSFSIFITAMVRWIDVSSFMLLLHSSVHSSIYVDLVLPGVEVLCLISHFLSPLECFRVSMGDILSAWCDILKVSHAHRK